MGGKRQALSSVGGEIEARGDFAFRVPLAAAMRAQTEDAQIEQADSEGVLPLDLTHGFHAYPARMHPAIARVLLAEFWRGPGSEVLDPFCGSGTVPLEALVGGWHCLGSDLDPLALLLSRVKTQRRRPPARDRFRSQLKTVAAASSRRVRERVEVRAALSAEERSWYEVHVLKELAGLLEEIRSVRNEPDRLALELVFSAIVVKFSRQRSETAARQQTKRLRKGLATEFFVRKGEELLEGWEALSHALPTPHHAPRFVLSDARTLPRTLSGEFRCDLVLSSPPYGGTYDYLHHHARRHAWLQIAPKQLSKREMGARRNLSRKGGQARGGGGRARGPASSARVRWDREVGEMLAAMSELLNPEGVIVLLVGDAEVGGERVDAAAQLEQLAPEAELEFLAAASQPRPDWRGGEGRREHLVALCPAGA